MAEALRRLANDAELRRRKGEAARARVVSAFRWESRAGFLRDLYAEIVRA
jgi:glycosyltransferase involved in cell wall biosynthesis